MGSLRTFIDTKHIQLESWHAFCQAINKGIEGDEWGDLYSHYRELNQAARTKKAEWESKGESPLGDESGLGQL